MARPREFELDDAVAKAMNVFWQHGYRGTSLPHLLEGMGITRGSLYKAFGSKKALFMRALERYEKEYVDPGVDLLMGSAGDGGKRIVAVFDSALRGVDDGETRGCLLCNTIAEADDPDITKEVQRMEIRLTTAFRHALTEEPIASDLDAESLDEEAANLTQNYVGLRILARGERDASGLRKGAEARLRQLRA
ncbi:MAG: TetR/AcrR family transcriptional regulator [Pseudomonadota bacterium]